MSEQLFNGETEQHMERQVPKVFATRIIEGMEFGDGKISSQNIDPEILRIVDETIETYPNMIVPVDYDSEGFLIDDDGCGDGRGVKRVFRGLHTQLNKSLHRAKVFGGALAMTAGIWIGRGQAQGKDLEEVFAGVRGELDAKDINFGGHVADHVKEGREHIDCGCGAIDMAPEIVQGAIKYENPIRETFKILGIDTPAIDTAFDNYRAYASTIPEQPEYSGKRVMHGALQDEKVIKELEGPHLEARIVLCDVEGFTVNQALIREKTDGEAQVFAVDLWRLRQIAAANFPGDEEAQNEALVSELIYTLATAGVLTNGDLPVYLIQQVMEPELEPQAA